MSNPLRRNITLTTSRFTSTQRVLLITVGFVLALGGVVLSKSPALRDSFPFLAGSRAATEQRPPLAAAAPAAATATKKLDLLRLVGVNRSAGRRFSVTNVWAPTVTATKTDTLFTDVDGDLQADPGDTLKYTVNINASGEDATGVTFTDTVDPNTNFVGGSLTATPVAVDDSYAATGNVRISVPAPGVLGNDFTGVPAATITAPSTSVNGGNVAVSANGSFTYNPPAGFEGTDTFSYTLTNASGSNSATVTITVSGMIWFINNTASCPCDGRLTNPFNTLAAFAAVNNGTGNNPAANDNIFLYESAIDYVGPVTLLNGQRFLGQDSTASLSAMTGITPPIYSDPLPATNSANATIVNITSAGNSINVASGNTLRGFTGGNSVSDISGTGFGTLTISDVTLNGTGQALDLTTGTLAATFGSISSTNSATTGISLTGVAGSLTSPTTTVTNPAGIAISVGTSTGTLNFGNTTATGSGSTGVSLLTNSGAISFGALNISPDANQRGLLATDNTNTITSTGGAISTSGAIAVEITRSTLTTPLAVALTSVSANSDANGIVLRNTSGSFTVNGDGTNVSVGGNSSGGTISGMSGADGAVAGNGVYLDNAGNVTLRRMTINGTNQNHGIRGINGNNGFTLEYSTVSGTNGTNATLDEGSIIFNGLLGTSVFTSNVVSGSIEDNFRIRNSSGSADVTVTGSTFSNAPNDNLIIEPSGTSNVTAHVTNNTFTGAGGDHFQTATTNSATLNIVFTGNFYSNGFPGSLLGGVTISGGNAGSTETVNFNISNNGSAGNPLVGNVQGGAINVNQGTGGGTWQGQVSGNFIGNSGVANSGSTQSSDIRVENHSVSGTMTAIVNGNTLSQWNSGAAINFQVGDTGNVNAAINLTVTNNLITNPGPSSQHGVQGNFGVVNTGTNAVCFDFKTNTVNIGATPPNAGADLRLRQRNGSTVRLPGYVGASNDLTAVQNFEIAQNTLTAASAATQVSATVQAPGGGFVGGAACNSPTVPTLLFKAAEESATINLGEVSESGRGESVDTLRAAGGEVRDGQDGPKLRQVEISGAVLAAIERWRDAGISGEDLMRLQSVAFEIADLPDGQLATVNSTRIKIDETAAGYGWYVDPTPMEDSEFDVAALDRELQTTETSTAVGRMDLLTVVMRELGVIYRQGKTKLPKQLRSLMENTLSPAVRRLPDSRIIQLRRASGEVSGMTPSIRGNTLAPRAGKVSARSKTGSSKSPVSDTNAGSNSVAKTASRQSGKLMHHAPVNRTAASFSSMLADVMLNIGTLPAGESVTITFNVTVDDPFTGALPQVSNQGTVSGSNFADVLTDDPSVGGTADPTVTPIDLPAVTLAVSPSSVLEDGATNLVYTFTRTGSTANAMTVNFSVGGSASFTQPDYTQTGAATFNATSGTVVIPGGSSTATVTVDPSLDLTVEPDETVVLTVTTGAGYTVGSPSGATGTITNDDTDVSVAVSPGSVAEDGATNLVYTFTRTGVTTGALAVNFSIGGTANFGASPNDYTQTGATLFTPPAGVVTFGAGNSTATVTVDPETDSIVEPDETVDLTITAGVGYSVGSPSSASGTITNDDTDVSVAVAPGSVAEDGASNLVYTFTRTGVTTGALTVNFSVGGTASFGASPNDYTQTGATSFTPPTGTVTFSAGSPTATVTIDPEADSTIEPDETVDLTVTSGVGYNVGAPASATGTITNDDTSVSVAVAPTSVGEDGAANLVYTFTRTGVTTGALTVNFSVGGSATFGASPNDYTQTGATSFTPSSGTVTFANGSSTATITIDPEADTTVELDETIDLTVTSGAGYNVGSPASASGTITNDDTDVSVAVSPASVAEDGATNLVYTFTRAGVTGGALTVNFSVGGTASFGASPNDYTQTGATSFTPPTGTVTFGAGSSTATVTVDPETDTTIEPDETVVLTLTAGAGYNVSSPSSASGTITNDDADVSVAVAPSSVVEDSGTNLVYTFTRTGFTGSALTVNFSVGGSAVFGPSPDDYTQTGATTFTTTTGTVTFAPASSTATVTVDPETDTTAEADETVVITLTAGAGYNVVAPSSATGTILNDDTLVSVAVAPSSTAEGGPNLVYTFTRTGPTSSAITVNFSVGGSATFPADYSQGGAATFTPPTATVMIGAGSSTATVNVTPLTDCDVEGSETVQFTVTPGAGYGVGSPSSATGTITNTPDSSAPTITLIPNVNMTLWPPNHQYESVAVTDFVASASDNCDPSVDINSVYILKITSDEVEDGAADGNTLNDIVIGANCKTAQLRAERSGNGDGRVYSITFKVKDSAGNSTTATTTVTVRSSPNSPAVDSGTNYTVNSVCP